MKVEDSAAFPTDVRFNLLLGFVDDDGHVLCPAPSPLSEESNTPSLESFRHVQVVDVFPDLSVGPLIFVVACLLIDAGVADVGITHGIPPVVV